MLYTKGYVNDMDVHVFPTIPDLLLYMGFTRDEIPYLRSVATKQNWGQIRQLHKDALDQARRVAMLNKKREESELFDEDCLKIAKAGLRQIKAHFAKSSQNGETPNVPMSTKELMNVSQSLHKFQVIGRIALGDTQAVIQEKVDGGMDLESLSKEELRNLNEILANAETKKREIEHE